MDTVTMTWIDIAGCRAIEAHADSDNTNLPLLVALHGRGDTAQGFVRVVPLLAPHGYRVLIPEGYFAWGGGRAWYAHSPPREQEVRASRAALMAFVTEANERYQTPPARTALVGFSQGGLMAIDVGLRFPKRLAAIVSMSGYLFMPQAVPVALREAGRSDHPPILLVHGLNDEVVWPQRSRYARNVLSAAGLQVELHELPIGHDVTPEAIAAVLTFLQRALASADTSGRYGQKP
jgi:phospholipase/carboxylesterase